MSIMVSRISDTSKREFTSICHREEDCGVLGDFAVACDSPTRVATELIAFVHVSFQMREVVRIIFIARFPSHSHEPLVSFHVKLMTNTLKEHASFEILETDWHRQL